MEKSCAELCRSALSLAAIQLQAGLAQAQKALASAAAVLASAGAQAAADEVVHAAMQAAAQSHAEGSAESSCSQPQSSETTAQLAARLGAGTDLQARLLQSEIRVLQQVQFLDQFFRPLSTGLAASPSRQSAAALSVCQHHEKSSNPGCITLQSRHIYQLMIWPMLLSGCSRERRLGTGAAESAL